MGFVFPQYLWALLLLILPVALFYNYFRNIKTLEESPGFRHFTQRASLPNRNTRFYFFFLFFSAFLLLITALAEPYFIASKTSKRYKNVKIFFLVDVSKSMVYAEDVLPNRLEAVKKEISSFVDVNEEYEMCLLPFSGTPNPYYCPLTYSKKTFRVFLENLGIDAAPASGTDINKAFEPLQTMMGEGLNLIVLVSDGGREESDAIDKVQLFKNIKKLKKSRTYVVGVGGNKAAPLLVRNRQGGFVDYVKEDGKIATSLLDEELLKKIAVAGNGQYIRFGEAGILKSFLSEVIEQNRIAMPGEVIAQTIPLQSYFFALSALLFIFWALFCRRP